MNICVNCSGEIKDNQVECTVCKSPLHDECKNTCIECGKFLCDVCSLQNNFRCTNCTSQIEDDGIKHVRRSHLELYKTCPYAFYLEVIKGVEVENNVYAETGIILHELFEKHSLGQLSADVLVKLFDEEFDKIPTKHFDRDGLKVKMRERGHSSINGYLSMTKDMPPPFVTEENIMYSIDSTTPKISITMDRINKLPDGELELIDYKTGKVFVGKKLSEDLQTPTYILAIKSKYNTLPKYFRYLFVDERKERVFERINDNEYVCRVGKREYKINLQEAIRELKTIFARIKQKSFNIPSKINLYHCQNFCYFGKTGICAGGEHEQWKKINRERIG